MNKNFYLTTTLPYVNAEPHIGFALEIIQADLIVRYHQLLGDKVFFNTGTDEHGIKIYNKAKELCYESTQAYVDEFAAKFRDLKTRLGIFDGLTFIRTTDDKHKAAAQEFWNRCLANDDIYKQAYKVKYCIGCELEKTDSELDDSGRCPLHPSLEIELIEEENYFFRFSKYQGKLLELYKENPNFVLPAPRQHEITKFVESGLQDFSISRLKEKMPWGVPVPNDDLQVMYVWFDALVNYVSTLDWPNTEPGSAFETFWGTSTENATAMQIAGKDNLRQQSAMWQAMLMSADLPPSKQILIHGFITSGGHKMSKSLGNVHSPYELLERLQGCGLNENQAIDALRYYLVREIPTFEDGDFTWEKLVESYNANLANGIGNAVSRVLTMTKNYEVEIPKELLSLDFKGILQINSDDKFIKLLAENKIDQAMDSLFLANQHEIKIQFADENMPVYAVQDIDLAIANHKPFSLIKTEPEAAKKVLKKLLIGVYILALKLEVVMPNTSYEIVSAFKNNFAEVPKLFPRIIT